MYICRNGLVSLRESRMLADLRHCFGRCFRSFSPARYKPVYRGVQSRRSKVRIPTHQTVCSDAGLPVFGVSDFFVFRLFHFVVSRSSSRGRVGRVVGVVLP